MAVDHTAQKLHHIRLGAGGGKPISAGAAAVHPLGDVRFIHRQPRGQTVQHSADGGTVAFAKMVRPNALPKVFFIGSVLVFLDAKQGGQFGHGNLIGAPAAQAGHLDDGNGAARALLSCCI